MWDSHKFRIDQCLEIFPNHADYLEKLYTGKDR